MLKTSWDALTQKRVTRKVESKQYQMILTFPKLDDTPFVLWLYNFELTVVAELVPHVDVAGVLKRLLPASLQESVRHFSDLDYGKLRDFLLERYGDAEDLYTHLQKLFFECRQDSRPISEYIYDFQRRMDNLQLLGGISDRLKFSQLVRGLDQPLRDAVNVPSALLNKDSFHDFCKRLISLQQAEQNTAHSEVNAFQPLHGRSSRSSPPRSRSPRRQRSRSRSRSRSPRRRFPFGKKPRRQGFNNFKPRTGWNRGPQQHRAEDFEGCTLSRRQLFLEVKRLQGMLGRQECNTVEMDPEQGGGITTVISIRLGGSQTAALLDTGCQASIISAEFASKIGCDLSPVDCATVMKTANNGTSSINHQTNLCLEVGGFKTQWKFLVVDANLLHPVFIGRDIMSAHGWRLDFAKRQLLDRSGKPCAGLQKERHVSSSCIEVSKIGVYTTEDMVIPPRTAAFVPVHCKNTQGDVIVKGARVNGMDIKDSILNLVDGNARVVIMNHSTTTLPLRQGTRLGNAQRVEVEENQEQELGTSNPDPETVENLRNQLISNIEEHQQDQVLPLLKYSGMFSTKTKEVLGDTSKAGVYHTVSVAPGSTPKPTYTPRLSPKETEAVSKFVEKYLKAGVIVPADTPWLSPVLVVSKADGSPRVCLDHRRINDMIVPDRYEMPNATELMELASRGRMFSKLDASSAFTQIPVSEESQKYLGFRTREGTFQFTRMPFGTKNAPATFQRLIDSIVRSISPQIFAYLDDILVVTNTLEENVKLLDRLLSALGRAGIVLGMEKCKFFVRQIEYLGHRIAFNHISILPEKISAVVDLPIPTTVEELLATLGLFNYYRGFIHQYADLAEPLYSLLKINNKKGALVGWDQAQSNAFQKLKLILASDPVLVTPDFTKVFHVATDASDIGIAAVLSQLDEQGQERPVAFVSKSLSPTERRYSTIEREMLAFLLALNKLHVYLIDKKFVWTTDHCPLVHLRSVRDPRGRITRWILKTQPYSFEVRYKRGSRNGNADALSRLPEPRTDVQSLDTDLPVSWESVTMDGNLKVIPCMAAQVPELSRIKEWIQAPLLSYSRIRSAQQQDEFCLQQMSSLGGHYVICPDSSLLFRVKNGRAKLVVPLELRDQVLVECHDSVLAGHGSARATLQRVAERFYWPYMEKDVDDYVKHCDVCQRNKRPRHSGCNLGALDAERPGFLALDFFGPLPRTSSGHQYVLLMVDHCTKFLELVPSKTQNAQEVILAVITRWIPHHGVPSLIHSDQGAAFMSQAVRELCDLLGSTKSNTTAYNPRGDGVAERTVGTAKKILRNYITRAFQRWDELLPVCAYAYNTMVHSSTGYTPFFLEHGRQPFLSPKITTGPKDPNSSVARWLQHLADIYSDLRRMNAGRLSFPDVPVFEIGDHVLVARNPVLERYRSMLFPYEGPAVIISRIGTVYTVRFVQTGKTRVVNVRRLKRYRPASSRYVLDSEPDVLLF